MRIILAMNHSHQMRHFYLAMVSPAVVTHFIGCRSLPSRMGIDFLLLIVLLYGVQVGCFYVDYFAFGANMNPNLLEKRTFSAEGSLKYERAILYDYKLVFNTGLSAIGMAASVEPSKGSSTHGLCYKLNLPQFNFLLASEGFPLGYKVESVIIKPYGGTKSIDALTLRSGNGLISGKPSERYINLLRRGADESQLDEAYRLYLNEIEPTRSITSRIRS